MLNTIFIIFEKSYLIRQGLTSLVKEIQGTEISGTYNSSDSFASIIKNMNPDIVIMNKELYSTITQQTLKALSLEYNFRLIAITNGLKDSKDPIFCKQFFYGEEKLEITKKIADVISQLSNNKKKVKDNNKISGRERAVLECVAKGLTNKEIAEKLFISAHTVITHRKNIVKKLGIKTVSGLTVYAILNKTR
ncbi:MAG: hypothetical protein B6I20_08120 [Bacteroidetes bacterium 4572_117]|nr:MAG: hypothetical protein B6I20_08120 [Bacteroidetes bacterium 4572_117]